MLQSNPFSARPIRNGRRQPPHPRRQLGVALIEALISILIFSFGVLGLIGLEASAINFSVDAEDRNRASLFANEIASYMWLQNSVNVTTAQQALWNASIADPTQPMGLPSGAIAPLPTATANNYADITITWVPITDKTNTMRQLSTRVILR